MDYIKYFEAYDLENKKDNNNNKGKGKERSKGDIVAYTSYLGNTGYLEASYLGNFTILLKSFAVDFYLLFL